jgi:hypothetical protein
MRFLILMFVVAALALGSGCGSNDDEPATGAQTTLPGSAGAVFDDLPRHPRSDPVGPLSVEAAEQLVVQYSLTVRPSDERPHLRRW